MTNGEKMQAVFPDIEMWGDSKDTLDYSLGGMIHRVTKSWWNAKYKERTTESGISNKSIIYKAKESKEIQEDLDKLSKLNESTTKSETLVSLDVYNQVAKERNIAIQQLHELGYEFGQKIEPTKNDLAHNLCDSCTNIGCEFQSGIVRTKCAFYMPPHIEPDNCGNYVVQDSTTKNDLGVEYITKQAAIDCLDYTDGELPITKIKNLPSAAPLEPRKGKWLRMSDLSEQEDDRYKCSRCGNVVHHKNKMDLYTFNSWCGRCGSDNDIYNYEVEK